MSTNKDRYTWLTGLLTGWGIKDSWAKLIAGAVIGGVTGAVADRAANSPEGLEITYRMEKTGEEFVTAQARKGSESLKVGQRVRIVESEDSTRVVPAE